jgi:predicted nucleotidyltransferase
LVSARTIPKAGIIVPNMGIKRNSAAPGGTRTAAVLFTPVQQRVLGLLFGQPDRSFQGNELIRIARSGTGAVHRLLTRLAESGLVNVEQVGNQKHYSANRSAPIFGELHGLVVKTVGLKEPIERALAPLMGRIRVAFVFGSIAAGTERTASDVDLFVIAEDLPYPELYAALEPAEAALARPINPNVMTPAEWRRKRSRDDSFATRVANRPKVMIVGSEDELG